MGRPSQLEYAILGLLQVQPSSGYDVRKTFMATPMRHFSDSPGAVYPAIGRLEHRGWITAQRSPRKSPRGRRAMRLTVAGSKALRAWVRAPLDDFEADRPNAFVLRFAFADGVLPPNGMAALLQVFRARMDAYAAELRRTAAANAAVLPPAAALALDNGIRSYETQRDWAAAAIAALRERRKVG